MSEARACPLCGATARLFLVRRGVPVHQNLVVAEAAAARAVTRGDLELAVCPACGLVFNQAFDAALLDYGDRYDNTQTCSGAFQEHVSALAERLLGEEGVRGCRIVEVGCGKGHFLRRLVAPAELGNTGLGFDPSYIGPEVDLEGRLRFRRCFYDDTCPDEPADVVVSRHVIEHTPDPPALLRTIRRGLEATDRPRVFLETPCVEWILRNGVVWDLFYEHCSLFTKASLARALEAAGLRAKTVRHVFGGQYLWAETDGLTEPTPPAGDDGQTAELAAAYARREQDLIADWRGRIRRWAADGPLALWGAAAKGCTLANLIDPDGRLINCLIDINPAKQGHYVPGTGHPIVGPEAIRDRGVVRAVLMNPNYGGEVLGLLRRARLDIELVR